MKRLRQGVHAQRVIGASFDHFAPLTSMRRIGCPVLLMHGTNDEIVPFEDAGRLQAAGLQGTVQCLRVAGGHDPSQAIEEHFPQLIEFLQRSFATALAPGQPVLQSHGPESNGCKS